MRYFTKCFVPLVCWVVLLGASASSENEVATLLRAVNEKILKASSYMIVAEVKLLNSTNAVPVMQFSGRSSRWEERRYSEMNGQTTVLNNESFISIDMNSKIISVGNAKDLTQGFDVPELSELLDKYEQKLMHDTSGIAVTDENEKQVTITFTHTPQSQYEYTSLIISKDQMVPVKVSYYLHAKDVTQGFDRIEMEYVRFELDIKPDPRLFSTARYVRKDKNGQYRPTEKYTDFELINLDEP